MTAPTVSVLGAGSWGTALALLLCQNFQQVILWGRDREAMDRMQLNRSNESYLPGVPFPENLQAVSELGHTLNPDSQYVVVVPSHAFRDTLLSVREKLHQANLNTGDMQLVWGTKGFDPAGHTLLGDVAADVLGPSARLGIISGPSFATETARALPTAMVLASQSQAHAESMAAWFRTDTVRVYYSDDPVGVQLGGAIKNVMAIAAGISDGLGFGANARAALITRGLSELSRLGVALGGRKDTFMGLTGAGDLILTCTDNQSRNRRFGIGIGQGKPIAEICKEIGQEIEGINTTRELHNISVRANVEMPITNEVFQIVHNGKSPLDAVVHLLNRDPKSENL